MSRTVIGRLVIVRVVWLRIRAGGRTAVGVVLVVAIIPCLFASRCNVGNYFAQKSTDRIKIDVLTAALGAVEEFA